MSLRGAEMTKDDEDVLWLVVAFPPLRMKEEGRGSDKREDPVVCERARLPLAEGALLPFVSLLLIL